MDQYKQQVDAVRALHFEREWDFFRDSVFFGQDDFPNQCDHCRTTWPCKTIKAIEGVDNGSAEISQTTSSN